MLMAAVRGRTERWQRWPVLLGLALQVCTCLDMDVLPQIL